MKGCRGVWGGWICPPHRRQQGTRLGLPPFPPPAARSGFIAPHFTGRLARNNAENKHLSSPSPSAVNKPHVSKRSALSAGTSSAPLRRGEEKYPNRGGNEEEEEEE